MSALDAIHAFLSCPTPRSWLDSAVDNLELLLVDHANCEKKAAATAMNLMYRYVDRTQLLRKMAQLAREELLHFEQVVGLMARRGIAYPHLGPSRYASALRAQARTGEPGRLVDVLIIGAFVEARSCERFAALAPRLDEELARFYRSLVRAEARHFTDYLDLARLYAGADIAPRVAFFAEREAELINRDDKELRFHSGPPAGRTAAAGLP